MDWMDCNRRGLIPGPQETEAQFAERVKQAAHLNQRYLERPARLYGISPDWVEMVESNQGLWPWHGAVMMTDGRKAALQLRARLPRWYDREELAAHELVHAGRCAFEEPKYEEFFAYRTSTSGWRRWLGPIIGRPWEVWLLLVSMMLGAWSPLCPLAVIAAGFTRLCWRHWKLSRCVNWLYNRVGSSAWAVAYRLTDREIEQAAKGRLQSDGSARWQLLSAVYGL